jgi:hypothetical protein
LFAVLVGVLVAAGVLKLHENDVAAADPPRPDAVYTPIPNDGTDVRAELQDGRFRIWVRSSVVSAGGRQVHLDWFQDAWNQTVDGNFEDRSSGAVWVHDLNRDVQRNFDLHVHVEDGVMNGTFSQTLEVDGERCGQSGWFRAWR